MSQFSEISFRKVLDESGDTATFLSFFLPEEEHARTLTAELAGAGVDACFYWYDNNWHYIRQWDHFKNLKSAAKLPAAVFDNCPDYANMELLQSDKIMGRTISMLIKLSWTKDELDRRIEKIGEILNHMNW